MGTADPSRQPVGAFRRIERFLSDGACDGAALAVAISGELVAERHWGQAAPGRPAGPNTLWPLASISKLYAAAAVMALVERGELTLGTPVRTLLPEFDGGGREQVTLRHLLTHTSGLIYESPEMEAVLRRQTPVEAIIDEAYAHPLQFSPGTKFSYSDFGIALAGRMAAVAAGLPFPEVVRRFVLEPGHLHQTFMPPDPADYGRVAHVLGTLAYGTDSAMYNSPYALSLAHPSSARVRAPLSPRRGWFVPFGRERAGYDVGSAWRLGGRQPDRARSGIDASLGSGVRRAGRERAARPRGPDVARDIWSPRSQRLHLGGRSISGRRRRLRLQPARAG